MSGTAVKTTGDSDKTLIFLGTGLLLGLMASIAINLLSRVYPGIDILTPDGKSVFEPVAMVYMVATLIGIYLFFSPDFTDCKINRKWLHGVSGFLIMIGLSMLGTIL